MTSLLERVDKDFERQILPALQEFVTIPNLSPLFDSDNATLAETEKVITLVCDWCLEHAPAATLRVLRKPGLWPVLLVDIPGTADATVLCYGHLDKQPPMEGWADGLDSRTPVRRDGKLFGRGAVDDGYAAFAYVSAFRALAEKGSERPRCLLVLETSEESHSIHLEPYFDEILAISGEPSLVVCLDSVCGDYERFWYTTSIRGSVIGTLTVRVLEAPLHSGHGGGVVPSAFRLLRSLLGRIENESDGLMADGGFNAPIPPSARSLLARTAAILGDSIVAELKMIERVEPTHADPLEALLDQCWRPCVAVTGLDGLPPTALAGNVMVPELNAKLSVRLPPTCASRAAAERMRELFERVPPHRAEVSFDVAAHSDGWWAGNLPDWLLDTIERASLANFGQPSAPIAVGGGIPFIKPLAEAFPDAPILVAGLIGPDANAHGPDESLDIAACKKLTACLAEIFEAAAIRR